MIHTYPDGSQRVGEPPFPKLSPIEQAQGKTEPVEVKEEPKRKTRAPKAD